MNQTIQYMMYATILTTHIIASSNPTFNTVYEAWTEHYNNTHNAMKKMTKYKHITAASIITGCSALSAPFFMQHQRFVRTPYIMQAWHNPLIKATSITTGALLTLYGLCRMYLYRKAILNMQQSINANFNQQVLQQAAQLMAMQNKMDVQQEAIDEQQKHLNSLTRVIETHSGILKEQAITLMNMLTRKK